MRCATILTRLVIFQKSAPKLLNLPPTCQQARPLCPNPPELPHPRRAPSQVPRQDWRQRPRQPTLWLFPSRHHFPVREIIALDASERRLKNLPHLGSQKLIPIHLIP